MLRVTLAAIHLLALGIGLGAVWVRAVSLRQLPDRSALRRAFLADGLWGAAAGLWIVSGLWRWLGALEKSSGYYVHNHLFLAKMGVLVCILALEVWPMVTLIHWRVALGRGAPDSVATPLTARRVAGISFVQTALVVVMVFLAVAMARGYGARS